MSDSFKLLKPFSTFPESNQKQFSIMSWNTLIKTENNNNGSEYCKWDHRLSKIHKTIESFNADIVCLQECHRSSFINDFSQFCSQNEYEFKLNDKDNQFQDFEMTTAIIWKKKKFKYKYHDFRSKGTIILLQIISDENETKTDDIYIKPKKFKKKQTPNAFELYHNETKEKKWHLLTLKQKEIYIQRARNLNNNLKKEWRLNNNIDQELQQKKALDLMESYLFITNVHLEAHGNIKEKKANKKEMRFNQIKHSMERITNYSKHKLRINALHNIKCVFCGDFNDDINSDIHKMLITKLNDNNEMVHGFDLKNAYIDNIKDLEKQKGIISHWISKRLIDHFYYTFNNLKCIFCVDIVPDFMKSNDAIMTMKYPNKDIVSDHLPIAAMFEMEENHSELENCKKRKLVMMDNDGTEMPPSKKMKLML